MRFIVVDDDYDDDDVFVHRFEIHVRWACVGRSMRSVDVQGIITVWADKNPLCCWGNVGLSSLHVSDRLTPYAANTREFLFIVWQITVRWLLECLDMLWLIIFILVETKYTLPMQHIGASEHLHTIHREVENSFVDQNGRVRFVVLALPFGRFTFFHLQST